MDSTPGGEEPGAPVIDDTPADANAAQPESVAEIDPLAEIDQARPAPLPLPPPPEPIREPTWPEQRSARPGQLTPAWRLVFGLGWVGVGLAFAAVWRSGDTLGLSPWWLGPSGDPNPLFIQLIPFVPSLVAIGLAMRNARYLPWVGIAASLALVAVAAGDVDRFNGIAVVEFAAAGAGLLISLAAFAGMLRAADAPVDSERDAPRGPDAPDDPDEPHPPDDLIDVLRPPVTQ